ncbi:MAG: PilW family protein [Nitrospirota bacterium]
MTWLQISGSARHASPVTRHGLEAGATLVELMFGMTIALVLVGAGYTVMNTSQRAATTNDQTAEMQENAMIAMELVARDLKMAGFGVSGAVGNCNNAIVPLDNVAGGTDIGPDQISLVVPTLLSTLASQPSSPVTAVTLQSGAVAAMSPEGFGAGASISIGGAASAVVSTISGDTLNLSTPIGAPAVFPPGTQVYWLRCIRYAIERADNTVCGGPAPCLLRGVYATTSAYPASGVSAANMVPIADGIEDMQFAYACDGCNGTVPDGIVDDQNLSNTFDATDFIPNGTLSTVTVTNPDTIRLVRVSIVARQARLETSDPRVIFSAPANFVAEDHNPAQDSGFNLTSYQPFRRRLLTRTVQVRNVGL